MRGETQHDRRVYAENGGKRVADYFFCEIFFKNRYADREETMERTYFYAGNSVDSKKKKN